MIEVTHKLDKLFKKKSEVQIIQRKLDDNLKVRQYNRDLREIEGKIKDLNAEIKTYNKESLDTQCENLRERHEQLLGEVI
jgi:peptidoglycan hydrolase CwlO-like protein